jgi:hypothetical protein
MLASVVELDPGSRHKVDDGARHEDFTGGRDGLYPLGQMDRKARHVLAASLDLSDVKPCSEFQLESPYRIPDGDGAVESAGRAIKRGERAITGRLHQPSTKAGQLAFHRFVVLVETLVPDPISQGHRLFS